MTTPGMPVPLSEVWESSRMSVGCGRCGEECGLGTRWEALRV